MIGQNGIGIQLKKHLCLFAAVVCISAYSGGCDDDADNSLEGSVTDNYDMSFDKVRIRLYPDSALSVEYIKNGEAGEKIPLRVTINYPELQLAAGMDYDLTTAAATISRGVGYDSLPLPDLVSGTVHLSEFNAAAGSTVKGDFESVYTATTGNKINLRGTFSSKLERVE